MVGLPQMVLRAQGFGSSHLARKCRRHLVHTTSQRSDGELGDPPGSPRAKLRPSNSAQTALQQLETLQQHAHQPVGQFGVCLNQLLVRADPTMPEHVKLFFLWPRLRPDITRRARDQGPKTFNDSILIAQRIKACTLSDSQPRWPPLLSTDLRAQYQGATPMDIDVQNVPMQTRRNLPNRDAQGCRKCFYCHNYGHVRRYCRKLQQQSHKQQAQITMVDATSLAELLGN